MAEQKLLLVLLLLLKYTPLDASSLWLGHKKIWVSMLFTIFETISDFNHWAMWAHWLMNWFVFISRICWMILTSRTLPKLKLTLAIVKTEPNMRSGFEPSPELCKSKWPKKSNQIFCEIDTEDWRLDQPKQIVKIVWLFSWPP